FPNPVKPDYTGLITITGLIRDSNVKITDINGNLIFAGSSVGGQFTWNGRNSKGRRVASGVYLVLAADAEGKEGIATKILIIK
ncbi:MAG: Por secretion system protein, partial [Bacteroidetes bacterium]|nr:Por secretion system protein [Bacteroidota bacterium]